MAQLRNKMYNCKKKSTTAKHIYCSCTFFGNNHFSLSLHLIPCPTPCHPATAKAMVGTYLPYTSRAAPAWVLTRMFYFYFCYFPLPSELATACEQLRGTEYRRHEEKVLKARKKKFWFCPLRASAQLCARTYLVLAEKKIHMYHTIFFLAAGNKLALLVNVWYILCTYVWVSFVILPKLYFLELKS